MSDGQCFRHDMVVVEASTCPTCGKADFRRLKCNNCSHVQTDHGTCTCH